ncbi:MAG: GntR family transcriptional regulator [Pseudomonadota bacterium]
MQSLAPQKTLVEQAYRTILDAICDGTLKAGERLTQDEIAARLNVSRQPVMGALALLKNQGFLQDAGRRGLAVAPIDAARFEAIYQLRSAVEPLAVRLATARMNAADAARGRDLVAQGKRLAASGDARAILQADVDFHAWIYALSGNPLIAETMQLNWQHLRRAMSEVLRQPAMSRPVWEEHGRIVEAMAAGDADRAAQLMYDHIVVAYRRVRPNLSSADAAARAAA